MGMTEDDRIRHKNRKYAPMETLIPIIYPIRGSYEKDDGVFDNSDNDSLDEDGER